MRVRIGEPERSPLYTLIVASINWSKVGWGVGEAVLVIVALLCLLYTGIQLLREDELEKQKHGS